MVIDRSMEAILDAVPNVPHKWPFVEPIAMLLKETVKQIILESVSLSHIPTVDRGKGLPAISTAEQAGCQIVFTADIGEPEIPALKQIRQLLVIQTH